MMRLRIFTSVMTLLLFSFITTAKEDMVGAQCPQHDFCTNAKNFICKDYQNPMQHFNFDRHIRVSRAAAKKLKKSGVKYNAASWSFGYDTIVYPSHRASPKAWDQYMVNVYEEYMSETDIGWSDLENYLELVKKNMHQVLNASNLSSSNKTRFWNSIKKARMLTPKDILSGNEIIRNHVRAVCEEHGLKENMFFIEDLELVGFCPQAIANIGSRRNIPRKLTFVMGHELAHRFDYVTEKDTYSDYAKCIRSKYLGEEEPTMFGMSFDVVTSFLSEVSDLQMNETVCDYWAMEAFNLEFSQLPEEKRERFLIDNLQLLCKNEEESTYHPGAEFRLSKLAGRNKVLRHYLGCDNNSVKECRL